MLLRGTWLVMSLGTLGQARICASNWASFGFLGRNHDRPRACLHVLYPVVENGDAKRSPGDSAVNLIWNASASHGTTRGWGGGRLQIHVYMHHGRQMCDRQSDYYIRALWAPTALRSLGGLHSSHFQVGRVGRWRGRAATAIGIHFTNTACALSGATVQRAKPTRCPHAV